jgi:hypothetical protein
MGIERRFSQSRKSTTKELIWVRRCDDIGFPARHWRIASDARGILEMGALSVYMRVGCGVRAGERRTPG